MHHTSTPQSLSSFSKNDFSSHNFTTVPTLHTVPLPLPNQVHIYSGKRPSITWCYASPRSILSIVIPPLNLTSSLLAGINQNEDQEDDDETEVEEEENSESVDQGADDTVVDQEDEEQNDSVDSDNENEILLKKRKNQAKKHKKHSKSVTCLLQYYSESKPLSWSTLKEFTITDGQPTKVTSLANLSQPSKIQTHQIWRVQILNQDSNYCYSVSSFALHSAMVIDSCFCPELSASLELGINCQSLKLSYDNSIVSDVEDFRVNEMKLWQTGQGQGNSGNFGTSGKDNENLSYKLSTELSIKSIKTGVVESRGLCLLPLTKIETIDNATSISLSKNFQPLNLETESTIQQLDITCGQLAIHTLSRLSKGREVLAFTVENRLIDTNVYISQCNTTELVNVGKLGSVKYYLYWGEGVFVL